MTSKHTPGPWTLADDGTPFVYKIGERGSNVFSLSVQGGGHPSDVASFDERVANARLIAAAPDLLDALIEIVEDLTHEDHEPGDWSQHVVVKKARAAIAKATGGDA